jgi:hypothetical protein
MYYFYDLINVHAFPVHPTIILENKFSAGLYMSEIKEWIVGYGCTLCKVKLIKSRAIHLRSRLHEKNLEKYEKELGDRDCRNNSST